MPRRELRPFKSRGRILLTGVVAILLFILTWNVVALAVGGISHFFDAAAQPPAKPHVTLRRMYTVRFADTLSGIATRNGIPVSILIAANHLRNPNDIRIGQHLYVPYQRHPRLTESLIRAEARRQGLDPNFALGLAWEESGFNENVVSPTGAVGVMQLEPETAQDVATGTGRSYDIGVESDNISVGVYWLNYLVNYYHGDEQSAAAAYYEGQGNLATRGYLNGTHQYVANVMALKHYFASSGGLPQS